ncbi:hypothetical protein [Phenylobacterium sp.]|uniref:hypothetical protein n=1 Tax=Phenylobacterium sp. TaxID=1871053 RepID=UPI0011FBFE7F|nr:hypothetical protein [Phenylobacterium sp.]THD61358.1 MAG: hypothetical protein E8A49_10185 [Phenylobacterium sp.]
MAGAHGQTQRRKTSTHESFLRHGGFLFARLSLALCAGAIAVYAYAAFHDRLPQGGGTTLGYTLGALGAILIVWLALLGVRKRAVSDGHYSLKAWVSAHVYLGLSLIVIATLHTGFKFGLNVHTLAYGLMLLVIASGAVGVWAYATLPRALSNNRGDTTRKQMLGEIHDLDEQLLEAAQPLSRPNAEIVRLSLEGTDIGGGFWRRLFGAYGDCANDHAIALVGPALQVASGREATALRKVDQLLRDKAKALGKARRQMHITALLEAWLFVHVPATFALLAALLVHIVSVFLYW